ncbi:sialidase family protein [Chondromyces crocatus]|uniref:Sortilin N-terminal domain-containing protein n=1 Tax=Chondromyces crocatus TaxID=52 RepID=A0A0K1EME0_CHOCO|nr:hypothetical protein [Chondromyces crocatus]AKT41798.1 uncharacterized protein CMC5_060090 [Chondromyces crocatus]
MTDPASTHPTSSAPSRAPLYIGSTRGLFVARAEGDRYVARPLGRLPLDPDRAWAELARKAAASMGEAGSDVAIPKGGLVVDVQQPGRLYVGTTDAGVYRSDDAGETWTPDSEGLGAMRIWSLVQHPVTGTLYAGTEPANLYQKHPGDARWAPCGSMSSLPRYEEWTSPNQPPLPRVRGIGLDRARPRTIAAAIEEGWIVRSEDGGETWENLTVGMEFDAHSVVLPSEAPEVMLATSGDGFYRSDDAGAHFRRCRQGLDRTYLSPLVMHPARQETLFVFAVRRPPPAWFDPTRGGDGAFYRSDDQGETWRRVGDTPFIPGGSFAACVDPGDPDTVCAGLTDGTVWMTRDGGDHVEHVLEGLGMVWVIAFGLRA